MNFDLNFLPWQKRFSLDSFCLWQKNSLVLINIRRALGAGVIVTTLLVGGCATVSRAPTDAFQAADFAITNAEKEQASEFAPAELIAARDKLSRARAAVAKNPREKDLIAARRLAEQAQSDAEFASARARDGREQAVNADLQKNNDTLREELQRTLEVSPEGDTVKWDSL